MVTCVDLTDFAGFQAMVCMPGVCVQEDGRGVSYESGKCVQKDVLKNQCSSLENHRKTAMFCEKEMMFEKGRAMHFGEMRRLQIPWERAGKSFFEEKEPENNEKGGISRYYRSLLSANEWIAIRNQKKKDVFWKNVSQTIPDSHRQKLFL